MLKTLAESEERFRQIAESIDDVFWMATTDRSTMLYVSPAYERVWQSRLHHLYESPKSWMDSILDEDRPAILQANEPNLRQGWTVEYRIRRPDGSVRWILDRAFPVFDAQGEVIRIVGVARDVTEQKEAENNLLIALDQVQRSNRELEDFAYVASHDLQEPLRKIKVFSDRLDARSDEFDEKGRDYLSRISRSAERMQTLIRDLLGYSRVATRAEAMRQVSLDQILTDVLNDLEVAIGDAQASIERSPLPVVTGDPRQLQQLMQNLLENALKFRRPKTASRIRVFSRSERTSVQILVEDNGIGIDEEFVERIFRPFQRLHGKGEYPGSGIGLAIVKKIADRHGAQIEVLPTPGGGATFCVTFARAGG
ncbi:sensor histidine kinase [Pseudazoarcus pumilus]|uniref:sensor histidine kinase n=1 Tax=Pseudazoarcus pumilus TaxID=2067960 RepID=UPI0013DD4E02|nr:PAS domain-containing sensor histidine kinase [Pseudazoarcus pumilus]